MTDTNSSVASTNNGHMRSKDSSHIRDQQKNFATVLRKPDSVLNPYQQIKNDTHCISDPRAFFDVDSVQAKFICSPYVIVSTLPGGKKDKTELSLFEEMIADRTGVFHGTRVQMLDFNPNDIYEQASNGGATTGNMLKIGHTHCAATQTTRNSLLETEWNLEWSKTGANSQPQHIVAFLQQCAKKIAFGYNACLQKSTKSNRPCMTSRDASHFHNAIKMEPELLLFSSRPWVYDPQTKKWLDDDDSPADLYNDEYGQIDDGESVDFIYQSAVPTKRRRKSRMY